jgi:hypothetical protein
VFEPPAYAPDASDPATVHLNGLLLTKTWSLCRIATQLPAADHRVTPLADSAREHFVAASKVLTDRHYHATHWIPTFALMAQTAMRDAGIN